ncbi:exosome complex component RRP43-like protein [Gilbertella persicaria]|uniref:exosome complex component RRP43-like protein n=1 Tax=Gilbertella persicaria TaxID=101096 RepID=UPI00221FC2A3|nr:exosome complex component RRP43-like protein [Gilbertella persicaria]KAI8091327.1 exosome complex component RRP43-like protein [Gilbertella persicaria]
MSTSDNFEIFSRIQPHEYLKRFLGQKVRPDGRLLNEFRKTMITSGAVSTANASAMVRLGGTTVVCGIKAEVCEPKLDTNQGYLVPNVELSPLCSPKFKPGPPPEKAQAVSEFINQLFIKSEIFPLEKLCIEEGKAVWVLYADIVCLNYDGNILDASLLALMTALKDLKLPKATVSPSMVVEADPTQLAEPIQLSRHLVASTFSVFNNPDVILSDANDTEESLARETVTIVMDLDYNLCRVYKNGGMTVTAEGLKQCIDNAKQRTNQVKLLIEAI